MTENKVSDPSATPKDRSRQRVALDRRKAALKANMARRKDQSRARTAVTDGQDETGHDPSDA